MGNGRNKSGSDIRQMAIALLLIALMVTASTAVTAGKGGKPGKPADDGGPLGSDYYTNECGFDDSTIIWPASEKEKGSSSTTRLFAFDLGPNRMYNDDDDGAIIVLGTPAYTGRFDIQGDHIVWTEFGPPNPEGRTNCDLYYWEFDSDEVISDDNGERAGLQLSTTFAEVDPNVWGDNVVFQTYPVDYETTPPPFTYYIRNFDDEDAVKLVGVTYVEVWDNYLAIQEADGDNAIVDLGTNGKFDGFSSDVPTYYPDLQGRSLNRFEYGCAIYKLKDEQDGTYDWMYLMLDTSSGDFDGPTELSYGTDARGVMETNGKVIAYEVPSTKKGRYVYDIGLYFLDGTTPKEQQITDCPRYWAWVQDIDSTRLMYTYRGLMNFYHFDTGTHEKLSEAQAETQWKG